MSDTYSWGERKVKGITQFQLMCHGEAISGWHDTHKKCIKQHAQKIHQATKERGNTHG